MRSLTILALLLSGCLAEWDVTKTPRRDPCTQVVEDKYVYVDPPCFNPPVRDPRDLDYRSPTYH
jgi:hypothetical protein